uniref:Uncharacterized protein n=1 Tax=Pyricularia oryzae (strain P131) TaxID=1143193 RepID=L7IV64_PYRO1
MNNVSGHSLCHYTVSVGSSSCQAYGGSSLKLSSGDLDMCSPLGALFDQVRHAGSSRSSGAPTVME